MSVIDILMTILTGGFWLLWVLVRNNHRNKKTRRNTERLLKIIKEVKENQQYEKAL